MPTTSASAKTWTPTHCDRRRLISLTRPTEGDIARVAARDAGLDPTYPATGSFHEFEHAAVVGRGAAALAVGMRAIENWQMHGDAGIQVRPVPIAEGETVTLWTRTLGVWMLFGCRITEIHNADRQFGFTYATLPGHPEQGHERFVLHHEANDDVVLRIHARSRPAILLTRAAGPLGRLLQRRYAAAYANAVANRIEND